MLRVTSVLYLQQLWSHPSSIVIGEAVEPTSPIIQVAEQEEVEQEHLEGEISLVTLLFPLSLLRIYIDIYVV